MAINPAFFDIFGLITFTILTFIGLKFRKYKDKNIVKIGYFLIVIGILGLIVDLYNVMHEYIIPLIIKN